MIKLIKSIAIMYITAILVACGGDNITLTTAETYWPIAVPGGADVNTRIASSPTAVYVPGGSQANVLSVVNTVTQAVSTITVGTNPLWAALSPDGRRVYVTNQGDNTVSVIDTALVFSNPTNAVIATISGTNPGDFAGPKGVAVSPDGRYVWVANEFEPGFVTVIDTQNSYSTQVISDLQMYGPWALAISPSGDRVYVSNGNGFSVSIIDTSTFGVSTLYGPPGGFDLPTGIAVAPNGNVYVVNNGGGANAGVTVIDPAGNVSYLDAIPTGSYGIAIAPDGGKVFVTNYNSNTLSVLSPNGNVITSLSIKGTSVTAGPAGTVFVNDATNHLSLLSVR